MPPWMSTDLPSAPLGRPKSTVNLLPIASVRVILTVGVLVSSTLPISMMAGLPSSPGAPVAPCGPCGPRRPSLPWGPGAPSRPSSPGSPLSPLGPRAGLPVGTPPITQLPESSISRDCSTSKSTWLVKNALPFSTASTVPKAMRPLSVKITTSFTRGIGMDFHWELLRP